MEKTRIYLIRHGESLGNAKHVFLGHTDLDLSELGYAQARAAATAMADVHFDAIYSSDLIRAYNTARPHAELRGQNVIADKGLREVFVGEWEGLVVDEVIEKYGEHTYRVEWRGVGYGNFAFPGGESVLGAGERFYNAIVDIAKASPGKTVLVAAHASVIRTFYALVSGIAPSEMGEKSTFPSNASCTVVDYADGKFSPIEFSDDSYLSGVGITKIGW